MTTTRILRELAAIAFANPKRVMKWGSNVIRVEENDDGGSAQVRMVVKTELLVINSSELDDAAAAAIQEVRRHADGSITVNLHPKTPALVKLGEHMGLFSDESAALPTPNSDNPALVYVDAPHRPETPEQWEARQRQRFEALGREIPSSE